ncbi:unnamed protein product [Urochloa decumbens]|uniref:Uncharacterized protein n=1 Tax=Urochloa decumbens TaxID=240449 RepID=A0ABC8XMV3_9POAL
MLRGNKKDHGEGSMSMEQSDEKPRHLYLVLDDWSEGYSIRKISLSPEDIRPPLIPADVARGVAILTGRYTLPSALFRFEGQRGQPKSIVGAFGSKILACLPLTYGKNLADIVCVFDVRTRISTLRPLPRQDFIDTIHIPIGDKLFVLSRGSFDLLNPPLTIDGANWENAWSGLKLPEPAFCRDLITSYAVHPDKQTIFVSSVDQSGVPATFTFETLENMVWRLHGLWQLPFAGRGYFVPKLGAFVGLSGDWKTTGHIASCVVSANSSGSDLKLTREKLFSVVRGERHIGATLVYIGDESTFCLLEGISIEAEIGDQLAVTDFDEMNETVYRRNDAYVDYLNESDSDETVESVDELNELDQKRLLRLTTFSLWYDRNGCLTTGDSRRVWYYNVSAEVTNAVLRCPVAFWM